MHHPVTAMHAEPNEANAFRLEHAALLIRSYRHWLGRDLPGCEATDAVVAARALYHAPYALLSHDDAADPCFTYANLTAQRLFGMPWPEIVGMPSRYSAEPLAREARAHLLNEVGTRGYIDHYSGVRIARDGTRFMIRNATVWNLIDDSGKCRGQAAYFDDWAPMGS